MTLKLSEAIRLGAQKRPQVSGHYFAKVGRRIGSCALGAAVEAVDPLASRPHRYHGEQYWPVEPGEVFPVMLKRSVPHPYKPASYDLFTVITSLNDDLGWTREQIADYVEGLGL